MQRPQGEKSSNQALDKHDVFPNNEESLQQLTVEGSKGRRSRRCQATPLQSARGAGRMSISRYFLVQSSVRRKGVREDMPHL
jgi:hypothetical protein